MSALSFYISEVVHVRRVKPLHRLRYRIAYVLADLDRLEEACEASFLMGIAKPGLMRFSPRDHGDGKTDDLAQWVRNYVAAEGVVETCARIELLTMPRMFGYVFNPLSVYFLYGEDGGLHHVLYEVNNTFGGRHFYLARAGGKAGRHTHQCRKELYVSPFFDVEGSYRFAVTPPDERVRLHIDYYGKDGDIALTANLIGKRKEVSTGQCLKVLAGFPLMTLGVIASIHWHALKLILKGARYRPAPDDKSLHGNARRIKAAKSKEKFPQREAA
jgi:DUF1365 family protein